MQRYEPMEFYQIKKALSCLPTGHLVQRMVDHALGINPPSWRERNAIISDAARKPQNYDTPAAYRRKALWEGADVNNKFSNSSPAENGYKAIRAHLQGMKLDGYSQARLNEEERRILSFVYGD